MLFSSPLIIPFRFYFAEGPTRRPRNERRTNSPQSCSHPRDVRCAHARSLTACWQAYVNNERVCVYGPGGSFGELALMYNCERAATVRATAPSRLWTMDLSTFRRSLATTANSQIVSRCDFLRKVPFLAELNNEQVSVAMCIGVNSL